MSVFSRRDRTPPGPPGVDDLDLELAQLRLLRTEVLAVVYGVLHRGRRPSRGDLVDALLDVRNLFDPPPGSGREVTDGAP